MKRPQLLQNAIVGFVVIFIAVPILWCVLDRIPPYKIISGKVFPENPSKNSNIWVEWNVTPLRSCSPQEGAYVIRTIIDSKGVIHTYKPVPATYDTDAQFKPGEIQRGVLLPENITGPAQYKSLACYPCNPIQKWLNIPICIQTPTLDFEIEDAWGPK